MSLRPLYKHGDKGRWSHWDRSIQLVSGKAGIESQTHSSGAQVLNRCTHEKFTWIKFH